MLTFYQTRTNQLLQYPVPSPALYATADLTSWINTARGQLAGDAQCIRVVATKSLTINISQYFFSGIVVTGTAGVSAVLNVRQITCPQSTPTILNLWPWEYFNQYFLSPGIAGGQPSDWAQYAPGTTGSFYLSPFPNQATTINLDTVCTPVNLVDDTTPEAIPYPWTDAVPYFAAYLALMSAQTNERMQYAEKLLELYKFFVSRARQFATSDVLPFEFEQSGARIPVTPLGLSAQKNAQ